jgi:uncharacterized OB-fold protein
MPAFEDDDELDSDSWDAVDDGPDVADIVPDELTTVRCTSCKKYIFEDSVRCPYCKHLQLEDERNRKPRWLVLTAIVCIFAFSSYLVWELIILLLTMHK